MLERSLSECSVDPSASFTTSAPAVLEAWSWLRSTYTGTHSNGGPERVAKGLHLSLDVLYALRDGFCGGPFVAEAVWMS